MTTTKRGGARPGSGQPRKSPELSAVVRFSLALPASEAAQYRRLGATKWVRRMLQAASLPSAASATNRPTMGHHNSNGD